MKQKRLWQWALAVAVLLLPILIAPQQVQAQSAETNIINQVNQFRATLGLPPFNINPTLAIPAAQQARFIAENNLYTHTGTGGSTPTTRSRSAGYNGRVSENIVGGSNMTAAQALAWWRNSPPHYNTITSDYYTEIGAGFAVGTLEQNIYTIVVGRPSDAPPPTSGGGAVVQSAAIAAPRFIFATQADDGSIVHTLEEGQALWTLGAYYDVEIEYLLRINNLRAGQFVRPGDEIVVRLADGVPTPTPLPTATPPYEHSVTRGQTLWTIAALHNLSIEELLYLNSLTENSFINPGDELIVRLRPGQSPPPTATPQLTHEIVRGQTLWDVALRYGLSLDDLLEMNALTENSLLQPGDLLFIRQPQAQELATLVASPSLTVTATVAIDEMTPVPTVTVVAERVAVSGEVLISAETPQPPTATPVALSATQPTATIPIQDSTPKNATNNFQLLLLIGSASVICGAIGLWLVVRRPVTR